jgi:hypothetical protein
MNISKLNEMLERGELPKELDFTNSDLQQVVDLDKLLYNAFYRSYDYFESRFPKGYDSIPGFDKIIQQMADEAVTPLEAITARQNNSVDSISVELTEKCEI